MLWNLGNPVSLFKGPISLFPATKAAYADLGGMRATHCFKAHRRRQLFIIYHHSPTIFHCDLLVYKLERQWRTAGKSYKLTPLIVPVAIKG